MPAGRAIFSQEIFDFFRALKKHNNKAWMDANRERYQQVVCKPFRRLLEELSPMLLKLDANFDVAARGGRNFSRINRDIRFAKDKTPYRAQMYLKIGVPLAGEMESGELYLGISAETATAGFRIYAMPKRKLSPIALVAEPKLAANPRALAQQKKRLSKRYESYWYSTVKGEWTKNAGWPNVQDWPRLQAWIVRKKLRKSDVTRVTLPVEAGKIFCDLYPLLKFTSL
ncbi:MAG TPA: DUF2461 family protein [Candidatus Acidoferrum sp.]|nr:DUF2461 family protein [Candidatus Acidoferrum sp.]